MQNLQDGRGEQKENAQHKNTLSGLLAASEHPGVRGQPDHEDAWQDEGQLHTQRRATIPKDNLHLRDRYAYEKLRYHDADRFQEVRKTITSIIISKQRAVNGSPTRVDKQWVRPEQLGE